MSSKTDLLARQRAWATSVGIPIDDRGYLASVAENLRKPMAARSRQAFEKGSGSELLDTHARPAKMRALHSSSALAVNVFDNWVGRNGAPLQAALALSSEVFSISFEEQFSTGLDGNPPNLDVAILLADGHLIGIESKFSEWLVPKPPTKESFRPKYFSEDVGVWESLGLPNSQRLAVDIARGQEIFRYLDAPQLLKHALGLATQLGSNFSLFYIYFDWPGKESDTHYRELDRFACRVGSELNFNAQSYQDLVRALTRIEGIDSDYLTYLQARYFGVDP